MAEEWFSLVPENIRTHSIDLAAIGVDGSAWPTSVAHEVIQALQDNGWAILGGDVYEQTAGGRLRCTSDNWFSDLAAAESWEKFVHRGFAEAQAFLRGGWLESKWVALVAADKPDALQLVRSHAR
jgi:hypothetical protein